MPQQRNRILGCENHPTHNYSTSNQDQTSELCFWLKRRLQLWDRAPLRLHAFWVCHTYGVAARTRELLLRANLSRSANSGYIWKLVNTVPAKPRWHCKSGALPSVICRNLVNTGSRELVNTVSTRPTPRGPRWATLSRQGDGRATTRAFRRGKTSTSRRGRDGQAAQAQFAGYDTGKLHIWSTQ